MNYKENKGKNKIDIFYKKTVLILLPVFIVIVVILINNCDKALIKRADTICRDQQLQKNIVELADRIEFSGSILVSKNEEILIARGFGYSDGEGTQNNNANTVYAIGSVSKQFTAAGILKLCDEKKLSLNDDIGKHVDDWQADKKIKINQLLQMQSGLERDFWQIAKESGSKISTEQFQREPHTETELMTLIKKSNLIFEPGTQYMYSNINYYVLAVIIEKVTGISYEEYIQKNFLEACNMDTAVMNFVGNVAPGHYQSRRTSENADLYKGAGTVCASVYDLYQWCNKLHGNKMLSAKSYQQMITPGKGSYGYGLLIDKEGNIWHNGQLNGYNSYVSYNPHTKVCIIILSNSRTYKFRRHSGDFPAEVLATSIKNAII